MVTKKQRIKAMIAKALQHVHQMKWLPLPNSAADVYQDAPAGDVASLPAEGPDFSSFFVPVALPGLLWTMTWEHMDDSQFKASQSDKMLCFAIWT